MSNQPPGSFIYADLREKWKHEDDLINQRVTWLINSQVFLFAAFGALAKLRIDYIDALKPPFITWIYKTLSPYSVAEFLVVVSALAVMYFLTLGISAAIQAMNIIKDKLREHQSLGHVWPDITVDVLPKSTIDGAATPKRMANTFFAIWIILFVYEIFRVIGVLQ